MAWNPDDNNTFMDKAIKFFDKNYKLLLIIPILMVVLSAIQIGYQVSQTGSFINKGIELKGGTEILIPLSEDVNRDFIEKTLSEKYPSNEIVVTVVSKAGQKQLMITTDFTESNLEGLMDNIRNVVKVNEYSVSQTNGALGASFFRETLKLVAIAFLFMGLVAFIFFAHGTVIKVGVSALTLLISVLIYYLNNGWLIIPVLLTIVLFYLYTRYSIPSVAVIIAAFSDILVTIAIINLLGIKVDRAGVAALLMLIGYSVDTDMLLSTRVLKRSEGTHFDRILKSINTGLMMTGTTILALLAGIIFSQSDVIRQIMIILLIGLIVDPIMTWIQNVGILRLYLEHKEKLKR